jgi:hypothetical protein
VPLTAGRLVASQVASTARQEHSAILGGENYKRPLGNLISRLDFACYAAGLPPLGCAAAEPFPDAWMDPQGRTWRFPRDAMCRGAKGHRWTDADFEKLRDETRSIRSGRARDVWDDEQARLSGAE